MAVPSPERDDDADRAPWHNRPSTLLAASVGALAAIALVIGTASWMSREINEPEQAPLDFVDPSFSATGTPPASAPTTTGTITSTSPPMTTDINPESTPPTTSDSETSRPPPSTRPPRTREDDQTSTTRKRPRTNVTRTLYPAP